jgi:hypothetical protein
VVESGSETTSHEEIFEMSDRTTLTAPATARARAEAIARGLAQTNPAAAAAYAEGEVHRVNAETRPPPPRQIERPPRTRERAAKLELVAKAIKLTLVVDPAALAGFAVPDGGGRVGFRVQAGGRRLGGELNPKTVRKVIATIAEHGAEAVAVVVQGKLGDGDVIEEAGITAQVKGQRAADA